MVLNYNFQTDTSVKFYEAAGSANMQGIRTLHAVQTQSNDIKPNGPNFIKPDVVTYNVEKPVKEVFVTEVKYDVKRKKVDPANIKSVVQTTLKNKSHIPQCSTRSLEYTVTKSSSFSFGISVSIGASMSITAGIPDVASVKTSSMVETTTSVEYGRDSEESTTSTIAATLELPEYSNITVSIIAREYKATIPFTAKMKRVYHDNSFSTSIVQGMFTGVSVAEITIYYGTINLHNGASFYEDNIGLVYKWVANNKMIWQNHGAKGEKPLGVWNTNDIPKGYCSIGDVAVDNYDAPLTNHIIVYPLRPGAVIHPIGFAEAWDTVGSGADTPITFYDMQAPCGYTCLGAAALTSRTATPDPEKYCCVNNEYLAKGDAYYLWDNKGSSAERETSIWTVANPAGETAGIDGGNFLAPTGHGAPYWWLTYHLNSGRVKPDIGYQFAEWSKWTVCSETCGRGTQVRQRSCQKIDFISKSILMNNVDESSCAGSGQSSQPCVIRQCPKCISGFHKYGAYSWQQHKSSDLQYSSEDHTVEHFESVGNDHNCADSCADKAGCISFRFHIETLSCTLIFSNEVELVDEGEAANTNVGLLSEYCEKTYQDIVQISTQTIELPGQSGNIKNIINLLITKSETELTANNVVYDKWTFNEYDGVITNTITYLSHDGDNLIPKTKVFIRKKLDSANRKRRESSIRMRRDVPSFDLSTLPDDAEVGEVGAVETKINILASSGNVIGSCDEDNVCVCIDGYTLEGVDKCTDIDECSTQSLCGGASVGSCLNLEGTFSCTCLDGYQQISNGTDCADIDECLTDAHDCDSGSNRACINTDGSFECNCAQDFYEDIKFGESNVVARGTCKQIEWSEWTDWGSCSVNGDGGEEVRTRLCTGGTVGQSPCDGSDKEARDCPKQCKYTAINENGKTMACADPPTRAISLADVKDNVLACFNMCAADASCKFFGIKDSECTLHVTCDSKIESTGLSGYMMTHRAGCEANECLSEATNTCHGNARCIDETLGYRCECLEPYNGDGHHCQLCPSEECWSYNSTLNECTLIETENCTTLTCGATSMDITFSPKVFGKTAELTVWASEAHPTWSGSEFKLSSILGMNGMSYTMNEGSIIFKLDVALAADNSEKGFSSIDLGALAVYNQAIGVAVSYECSYPTLVNVTHGPFDFHHISHVGSNIGIGNLAPGFSMSLEGTRPDIMRFVLGSMVKASVEWSIQSLPDIAFQYTNCAVLHGHISVDIIKDGCYAGLTKTKLLTWSGTVSSFEYLVFKGADVSATEQTIICTVQLCKKDKCRSSTQCPTDEAHKVFNYKPANIELN